VQKLVAGPKHPRKTYRLAFTITETENGKRSGVRSLSLVAAAGQRTLFKLGRNVPIETGTFDAGSLTANSQVQFQDAGLSIDAAVDRFADDLRLNSAVEQSSIAEDKSGACPQEPVVRQIKLLSVSTVTLGKQMILGSMDIPDRTRLQEIEVLAEPVN
jgi:hypothetical protein